MTIESKPLSNSQVKAAQDTIKAAVSADRADTTLAKRVDALRKSGVSADDIKGGGRLFADFQRVAAETALTGAQFATWSDDSLAQGKTIKGKRVDTERGRLVKRVNSIVARVRAKLKVPAKKGATAKRSATEVFFDTIDKYVAAFGKDDASNKFDFDPVAARKHLAALIKELK